MFFIKRTKLLKTGEAPVYMRITVKGERADFALNRSVNTQIWSSEKGACVGSTKEARLLNTYIESIRVDILVILTPHSGNIDPPLKNIQRTLNLTKLPFFS